MVESLLTAIAVVGLFISAIGFGWSGIMILRNRTISEIRSLGWLCVVTSVFIAGLGVFVFFNL